MSYLVVIACIFSSSICIVKKLKTKKGKREGEKERTVV